MSVQGVSSDIKEVDIPEIPWTKIKSLGVGDQAEVFLVQKGNEQYALKCFFKKEELSARVPEELIPHLFKEDGTSVSALEEWEVSKQLQHPNLLRYYELKQGSETTLRMEWVQGNTLDHISDHSFDLRTTLTLLIEAVETLQYAFEKGWIHRDLYSSNVMVDDHHHLKFIDLGSFELLTNDSEEEELLEEIQEKLLHFLTSIVEKGNLSHNQEAKIQEILKTLTEAPDLKAHQQDSLSPQAGPLFASVLGELGQRLRNLSM